MDIDQAFREVVGEFGSQQKKIFVALSFLQIYVACHMIHTVFIGAVPEFFCATGHAGNRFIEGCPSANVTCTKYQYNSNFTSVVSQWDLVCDRGYKVGLVQSIFMAGVLAGAVIFGNLADRHGRRLSLAVCICSFFIFSCISSFAPTYNSYVLLRLLAGIFCGGMILVSFVLMTELMGPSYRAFCGMIMPATFAVGIMYFSLLAYLIRSWRLLSLVSSLPGMIAMSFFWFLPESPRWLLSQGKTQDAERVLDVIAMKNCETPPKPIELHPPPVATSAKSYGLTDLMTNAILRKRTVIQVYAWFVCSACYYGLTMSAGGLGGNRYISVALSGMVELPAYFMAYQFLNRLGRKYTFCVSLLIGGAACLLILALPKGQTKVITSLALLGKLSLSAAFAVVYIFSAELYPTVIRSNAMSVCSMAARIGGIVSPMIIPLGDVYPSLQFLVFGLLGFTSGLLSFQLPETLGQPMPETLEDLDRNRPIRLPGLPLSEIAQDKVRLLEGDITEKEKEILQDEENR